MSSSPVSAKVVKQAPGPLPKIRFDLLDEPQLLFANNFPATDPKTGLAEAGPAALHSSDHPRQILFGIVGSGHTREKAIDWISQCAEPIDGKTDKIRQVPRFPGFNAHSKFQSSLKVADSILGQVTETEVRNVVSRSKYEDGFRAAVDLLTEKVSLICEGVPALHIVLCALPQELVDYCAAAGSHLLRNQSSTGDRLFRKILKLESEFGQQHLLSSLFSQRPESEFVGRNLRRALKASTMAYQKPIQIALESSLFSGFSQHPAQKAWNFCIASYHKATGALPWRLEGLDPDTCFVGVSFYRHLNEESFDMHTSLAQVITGHGDAFVLRGMKFFWDQKRTPHLPKEGAQHLMELVLSKYREWKGGQLPRRIVVHKTSRFNKDEADGFRAGLVGVREYDLLSIQKTGVRFFREGGYPPLRRTYAEVNDATFLYTNGYVPELGTYPKGYVPEPWELIDRHGDAPPRRLCKEILALTKMNFNNADFSDGEPITLKFARKIGEIMSYFPQDKDPNRNYRFYM